MSYVSDLSLEDFHRITMTQDAVIRRLEVIGEAVKWLDPAAKDAMPHIPWRGIGDMRNFMAHQYWDVDLDIVWSTVHDDLPKLIAAIEAYLQ